MSPRVRTSGNRIRVRRTIKHVWVWELVTPDGHVASRSGAFDDRALCEAEAKRQGLPVKGLARRRTKSPPV